VKHPLETSPFYARYLFSESLIFKAKQLNSAWAISDELIPKEVQSFAYKYFWNDRGEARKWFDLPGLNSFPHQVHPDDLHPLELATYGAEAKEIFHLVDAWCGLKKLRPLKMSDLAALSEADAMRMRTGDYDFIAQYLKATFEWWDQIAGPRYLREHQELTEWVAREREITSSWRWKLHSTLVRLSYLRKPFPWRGAGR
jgi:hypothetical protein